MIKSIFSGFGREGERRKDAKGFFEFSFLHKDYKFAHFYKILQIKGVFNQIFFSLPHSGKNQQDEIAVFEDTFHRISRFHQKITVFTEIFSNIFPFGNQVKNYSSSQIFRKILFSFPRIFFLFLI